MSSSRLSRKIMFSNFHNRRRRSALHKTVVARALFVGQPVADPEQHESYEDEEEDRNRKEEDEEVNLNSGQPVADPEQHESYEDEEEDRNREEEDEEVNLNSGQPVADPEQHESDEDEEEDRNREEEDEEVNLNSGQVDETRDEIRHEEEEILNNKRHDHREEEEDEEEEFLNNENHDHIEEEDEEEEFLNNENHDRREGEEQERGRREEDDEQEYEEEEQEFGSRIIIPFIRRIYLYVSNPSNGSVFLAEGGFMFPTPATLNRFKDFLARNGHRCGFGRSIGYFNSKTNQYGFRIRTVRDGPKRYVNPLFKENDESVFEINVKAIKTLVDAAGEIDSVRRDQVRASEKVREALLMLREVPVPGLHGEGRDAIFRVVEKLAVAVEENQKVTGRMGNLTDGLLQL